MSALADAIDGLTRRLGRMVAWAALLLVLIQFLLVGMRYLFAAPGFLGAPTLWWQESLVYLFGALILVGVADAQRVGAHVRVDVLYQSFGPRGRALVDLFGAALLLTPTCALLIWATWPNAAIAWRVGEGSTEPGGLPFRYLLKGGVLVMAGLLALQGAAQALRAAAALSGRRR